MYIFTSGVQLLASTFRTFIGTFARRASCFAQNLSKSLGSGMLLSFSGSTAAPPSKKTPRSAFSHWFIGRFPSGVSSFSAKSCW